MEGLATCHLLVSSGTRRELVLGTCLVSMGRMACLNRLYKNRESPVGRLPRLCGKCTGQACGVDSQSCRGCWHRCCLLPDPRVASRSQGHSTGSMGKGQDVLGSGARAGSSGGVLCPRFSTGRWQACWFPDSVNSIFEVLLLQNSNNRFYVLYITYIL